VIRIGPASADDADLLEATLPRDHPGTHRKRIAMQDRGEAAYLVAWDGDAPVGIVLVTWSGATEAQVRAHVDTAACPESMDLHVAKDRRHEGIGSALMGEAERLAAERGFSRIGLGVGTWNEGARALYESRGYREAGVPRYEIGDSGVNEDGEPWSWSETIVYLVKELRGP
jgi:GNAT superfamily N-acetyltransferase